MVVRGASGAGPAVALRLRGGSLRIRVPPAPHGAGRGLRGRHSFDHAETERRSDQDRSPRRRCVGAVASRRRAAGDLHPDRRRRGAPRSRARPRRRGGPEHPGQASLEGVPAAPRTSLSGTRRLDASVSPLARGPAVSRSRRSTSRCRSIATRSTRRSGASSASPTNSASSRRRGDRPRWCARCRRCAASRS